MLGPKTSLAVKVIHILILVVFFAWLPFCFQVMPDAVEIEECLCAEGKQQSGCPARSKAPRELLMQEDTGFGKAVLGLKPPEREEKAKGCNHEAGGSSRISLLSFLIALVGGGVFSLESFEAFPML
eukprot:TRINITY_DN5451_c0_g1_i1.p1 TRINITY_DN5451_c0_g1~~TRINITY_DN5451_c0_g1_i1.p1  ORF type:complete len:126 (+),score=33.35 TRINITY_DN5451_c0_g1_i1:141-518(+)